jgi:hypothetical protein
MIIETCAPTQLSSTQPLRYRVFGTSDEFVAWQDASETGGIGHEIVGVGPVAGDFGTPVGSGSVVDAAEAPRDPRLGFGLFVIYRERQGAL